MKRSTKLRTRVQGPSQPGPAGPGRPALSPYNSPRQREPGEDIGSLPAGQAAFNRRHIDLASGALRIELSVVELTNGSLVTGPPKSEAGKRIITLPPFLLPEIKAHLEQFTAPGDDSLVFVGPKNGPLRRPNFSGTWRSATESARLTEVHIHGLRHTGNHIAAATGASLRELMGRMGHSTTRAALVYQHRTTERDRFIATLMSEIVEAELDGGNKPSGTQRACGDQDESDDGREES